MFNIQPFHLSTTCWPQSSLLTLDDYTLFLRFLCFWTFSLCHKSLVYGSLSGPFKRDIDHITPLLKTPKAEELKTSKSLMVSKVMSVLFNVLSRFDTGFLLRSKHLLISWLQSLSAVVLEPKKIKSVTPSTFSPSICHEVMGWDAMILAFLMLSLYDSLTKCYSRSPENACFNTNRWKDGCETTKLGHWNGSSV